MKPFDRERHMKQIDDWLFMYKNKELTCFMEGSHYYFVWEEEDGWHGSYLSEICLKGDAAETIYLGKFRLEQERPEVMSGYKIGGDFALPYITRLILKIEAFQTKD